MVEIERVNGEICFNYIVTSKTLRTISNEFQDKGAIEWLNFMFLSLLGLHGQR